MRDFFLINTYMYSTSRRKHRVCWSIYSIPCSSAPAGDGSGEDAGVDVKAEEFIARFHAQMKLQRQISWLQYNEMMERSIS
jgi:hypothetical protein